jgi:hypothetical protein
MPWSAAPMAYSPIRPKSQISNVGHDGTLSIRNFILIYIAPKKCAPCFRGTRNFLFIKFCIHSNIFQIVFSF